MRNTQTGSSPRVERDRRPKTGSGTAHVTRRSVVSRYDAVVVGAGPAGCASAIDLALGGWRVLLVEKSTFPRDKVCGDFLSPRSLRVLDQLGCGPALRALRPNRLDRSTLYLNGEEICTGLIPKVADLDAYGLVVPRVTLDEVLFRRSQAVGVTTVEGFEAKDVGAVGDGVEVVGRAGDRSRAYRGRVAIVASGARTKLSSLLGVVQPARGGDLIALRAYFEGVEGDPRMAGIFFDDAYFPGYAWLFPLGEGRANVGLGMVMDVAKRYGINLRRCFLRWLDTDAGMRAMVGGARRQGRIVGWPLTTYCGTDGNYADRVIVVGDAASFVDPINGEGIHTALESARMAASVADEGLREDDLSAPFLSRYERRWRSAFQRDLLASDLIVTLIKNRELLPLWTLSLRMIAHRALLDPAFAAICGGVLSGVIPTHNSLAPKVTTAALRQPPEFWLRTGPEVRRALEAVLASIAPTPRQGQSWDAKALETEYATAWALEVGEKAWRLLRAFTKPDVPPALSQVDRRSTSSA